jgi:hypothetical protein
MATLVTVRPEFSRPNRQRLRELDACLSLLEDEAERGAVDLPAEVFASLPVRIPGIQEGTDIRRAIERIFGEQEKLLTEVDPVNAVGVITPLPAVTLRMLTEQDARRLTDRIKGGLGSASLLALEAHDRRAWSALGYRTWVAYARKELGLSRSRSYELLNHARVLQILMKAAGTAETPTVSPYAASQIQDRLQEAVEAIKASVPPGGTPHDVAAAIESVVNRMRSTASTRVRSESTRRSPADTKLAEADDRVPTVLFGIVERVLSLPSVIVVLDSVVESDRLNLAQLRKAADRLTEMADLWERRTNRAIAVAG